MLAIHDFEVLDQLLEIPHNPDNVCLPAGPTLDSNHPDSASTLVHTIETSDRFTESVSYRRSIDQFQDPAYSRIIDAYQSLDLEIGGNHVEQLRSCRTLAWFARHETTGEVKIISRKCGLRWCPVCQASKQAWITHEVSEWLKMFKHPKILTLTMKHNDLPLAEQIDELYENFRKLRRRKFFSSKVTGGVWFFQIKNSKDDGRWHPHIHCLITGMFLPRDKLSHLWLEITGDSPVTDIRAVKSPDTAVRHAARYCTSPCCLSDLSASEITNVIKSLHGRRIVGTWGKARSMSLRPKPQGDKDSWVNLGSYNTVVEMSDVDPNAKQILHAYKTNVPLPAGVTMVRVEELFIEKICGPPKADAFKYLPGFYD